MLDISGIRPETRYGIPSADQVLYNRQYIVGYSYLFRQPRWALQLIDPISQRKDEDNVERQNNFRNDPRVPEMFQASAYDYRRSGYDRGHLISSKDRMQRTVVNSETFLMSNMCPQHPTVNRFTWLKLEHAVRELAQMDEYLEVYTICGPIFDIGHKIQAVGKNRVMIPSAYFKSVLAENKKGRLALWSFVMPNKDVGRNVDVKTFLTPTEKVEWLAGLILWDKLHGDQISAQKASKGTMWSIPKTDDD